MLRYRWMQAFLFAVIAVLTAPQISSQLVNLKATAADSFNASASAQEEQDKDKHKDHKDEKQKGDHRNYDDSEFTEKDEIHQTYQLTPGATVRVAGINGAVDVETTGGSVAEVHIVRSARSRADLEHRKVIIEHSGTSLVVRGENDNERRYARGEQPQVRQRVTLRLPRQIDLTASGINGRTTIGEVDGPVKVSGINGKVEVAQAVGYSELSGINGTVIVTISQLGERGIRVSGINGAVELRFTDALNADLKVTGINGSVNADMPNVSVLGTVSRNNFNARIGSGGAPINVSGVNGRVRLSPRS
ncbi:MAG TPA: hypothetical protein VGO96_13210 [Pyrinomonadaceae bacterium]|nr:hypothetical protein [Pyrinomonadaceae bacterium]